MATSTTTSVMPEITIPYSECTIGTCPLELAQLPYAPNLAGNVLYLSIFSFCLLVNIVLGAWYRTWGYLVAMVFGCVLEILGYVGRIQMHHNPFPEDPFLLYLICVTIAPIFFTAAIYLTLSRVVIVYGESLSMLQPRTYTILFIVCDFISLLLQAGGGTIVSFAEDFDFEEKGLRVMQAGLCFQVLSLFVFVALCAAFSHRCRRFRSKRNSAMADLHTSRRFRVFLYGLAIAATAMIIRCAFRIAELSEGFRGHIWFNEILYMVFEGAMVSFCVLVMTLCHPGIGFCGRYGDANFPLRRKGERNEVVAEENISV